MLRVMRTVRSVEVPLDHKMVRELEKFLGDAVDFTDVYAERAEGMLGESELWQFCLEHRPDVIVVELDGLWSASLASWIRTRPRFNVRRVLYHSTTTGDNGTTHSFDDIR